MSGHVLGNRSLADINAELEELSMDARSAPERICRAHLADQLSNFEGHLGPAGSSSRLPAPEGAESSTMPSYDCYRPHDCHRIKNSRREPIQQYKDKPIERFEGRALGCAATQYIQLMPQRYYLSFERTPRPEEVQEDPPEQIEELEHPAFIARFGRSGQADGICGRDKSGARGIIPSRAGCGLVLVLSGTW
jgi:hypothetical protein